MFSVEQIELIKSIVTSWPMIFVLAIMLIAMLIWAFEDNKAFVKRREKSILEKIAVALFEEDFPGVDWAMPPHDSMREHYRRKAQNVYFAIRKFTA